MKVIETKDEFDQLLKDNHGKLLVVDFYADWCGPCKTIAPKVLDLAKEYPNVVFVKVNVDDNGDTSEEYEISAMPTFKFFKDGKVVDEVVGADIKKVKATVIKHA